MDTGDILGNSEPESRRTGILIACIVQTIERPEDLLALGFRYAGPVVLHIDGERAVALGGADIHVVGEAGGVVNEIGDGALEGVAALQVNIEVGDVIRHAVDQVGRDRVGFVAATGRDADEAVARANAALQCCRIETTTVR